MQERGILEDEDEGDGQFVLDDLDTDEINDLAGSLLPSFQGQVRDSRVQEQEKIERKEA